MLSYLGTVDMVYRGKLHVTATGLIANILLCFNEKKLFSFTEITTRLEISTDDLHSALKSVFGAGLVHKDGDTLKINDTLNMLSENKFMLTSQEVINMLETSQGQNTSSKTTSGEQSSPTMLKYVHKEHKFRVQSKIMKYLKSEKSMAFKDLIDRITAHFKEPNMSLVLDLTTDDIEKNIKDLSEKGYLNIDQDLGLYEYLAD